MSAVVTISKLQEGAQNLEHIAEVATSTELTATDRLGRTKYTLQGALSALGYQVPVTYATGINLTQGTQTVEYSGVVYAPLIADLPFTTSGTFETAKFRPIQITNADFINLDIGTVGDALKYVTPQMYYSGDWAAAFRNAATAGVSLVVVPPGDYGLGANPAIEIQDGQTWLMSGAHMTFTGSTGSAFRAVSVDGWALVGPFTLVGDGSGAGIVGTAQGIYISGCNSYRVENPTIEWVRGHGIYADNGTYSGTLRGDQGHIHNPILTSCYHGMEFVPGAEYCIVTAPMISGCTTGATVAAGNVTIQGGNIVDNTDGLVITGGSNHAHGIINGVNINHNTQYNVRTVNVTNGQTLADCHLYGSGGATGAIFLNNSKGIVFNGGHLDCWIYNYSGADSGYNYIKNMYCPGGYGDIERLESDSTVPDELIILDCHGPGAYKAGFSINDPAPVYVHVRRLAASTQVVGSATTLVLPDAQVNGNRRGAYNTSTGVFSVPAGQAGQYRISANLFFTGTGLSATDSYVEVRVNGANPRLYLLSPYSTTTLACQINHDCYLSAADTVTIVATLSGTSPLFGGASWLSSLSIGRIA